MATVCSVMLFGIMAVCLPGYAAGEFLQALIFAILLLISATLLLQESEGAKGAATVREVVSAVQGQELARLEDLPQLDAGARASEPAPQTKLVMVDSPLPKPWRRERPLALCTRPVASLLAEISDVSRGRLSAEASVSGQREEAQAPELGKPCELEVSGPEPTFVMVDYPLPKPWRRARPLALCSKPIAILLSAELSDTPSPCQLPQNESAQADKAVTAGEATDADVAATFDEAVAPLSAGICDASKDQPQGLEEQNVQVRAEGVLCQHQPQAMDTEELNQGEGVEDFSMEPKLEVQAVTQDEALERDGGAEDVCKDPPEAELKELQEDEASENEITYEEELPDGWWRVSGGGQTWFWHEATATSCWDPPSGEAAEATEIIQAVDAVGEALEVSAEVQRYVDEGYFYKAKDYFNPAWLIHPVTHEKLYLDMNGKVMVSSLATR